MEFSGNLIKMKTKFAEPVEYTLYSDESIIPVSEMLGKKIRLNYNGKINCIKCGRKIKKTFMQGYCYPCFISLPETDACILHPEKCRAHLGISRDMAWSEKNCLQEHYVYLAVSSGLKVGVTRKSQIPDRWIDQGAWKAVKIAKTPNRFLAGSIEVALKDFLNDKTNWRKMLQNKVDGNIDLISEKEKARENLADEFVPYFLEDHEIITINYPVLAYPEKVKSISLDKIGTVEGILTGIKGQYLIIDNFYVLNIRKHNGYFVEIEISG